MYYCIKDYYREYHEVSWYSLEQYIGFVVRQAFNYCCSLHHEDLMKTTAVVENLSYYKTNVLFQRIPAYFKIYSTV